MRRLMLVLFIFAAWAGWSSTANAAVVDIENTLPAGTGNTTLFLGGNVPTGGLATLRVDLTSLNGALDTLLAIRTVKWTHSTAEDRKYKLRFRRSR